MSKRDSSFGEGYKLTLVDRFGIFLSIHRVKKIFQTFSKPVKCLDIGCGYNATLLNSLLEYIELGVGLDVSINPVLKNIQKFQFIESPVEEAISKLNNKSFNVVAIMSVLEHLNDPLSALEMSFNLLEENGILLVNVPTWLGKEFLEFSAFKLGSSPASEMNDHKMYYDKKDLWPLMVKAGFKPSNIKLNYHKFGLNLFCEAKKS
jgi:SAM-dependent methyltransferase